MLKRLNLIWISLSGFLILALLICCFLYHEYVPPFALCVLLFNLCFAIYIIYRKHAENFKKVSLEKKMLFTNFTVDVVTLILAFCAAILTGALMGEMVNSLVQKATDIPWASATAGILCGFACGFLSGYLIGRFILWIRLKIQKTPEQLPASN